MPTEVTDPALIAQLEGGQEVTDPSILSQLNGGPPAYGTGRSYDAVNGQLMPTGSPEAQAAYSPVAGNNFLQNARLGVGKLYTDAVLGARQLYAQGADLVSPQSPTLSALVTGQPTSRYAQLQQEAADKRGLDAPLQGTLGGKVGEVAGALPLAFVPGANTALGATAMGGAIGAVQPTTAQDSRILNTTLGAGAGLAGKFAGDAFSNWLTSRAAQPFMGWNQVAGNKAAAAAVGSQQKALTQPAIKEASERFGQIFGAARSPDVQVPVSDATLNALESAGSGLNTSSKTALYGNSEVKDLTSLLGSNPSAEQLGALSSNLGKEAASQMGSQAGDRQLGQALYAVKEHVDDLIGQSIQDPTLKAAYDAARPQYRTFLTLTKRPTLLNSSTGDVNLRNLGNYLQRTDSGFRQGTNTSPLYQAARFGQASTIGSRPPPPILQPFKFAAYHALNNPVVGAIGGTVSRVGVPVAPALRIGLPAGGLASTPVLLPYLEQ